MQTHEFRQTNQESKLRQKVTLESPGLMQQQNFDALMYEKEQRFNMSKKEEVVPRYKSISLPYYKKEHED
jgi:hypothetical protein